MNPTQDAFFPCADCERDVRNCGCSTEDASDGDAINSLLASAESAAKDAVHLVRQLQRTCRELRAYIGYARALSMATTQTTTDAGERGQP